MSNRKIKTLSEKENWKTFLASIWVMLLISSCTSPMGTNDVNSIKYEYPTDVINNFIGACYNASGDMEVCSCMLEKIQHKYPYKEFYEIEMKGRLGQTLPSHFVNFTNKARRECGNK